jgi:hypothetical protein
MAREDGARWLARTAPDVGSSSSSSRGEEEKEEAEVEEVKTAEGRAATPPSCSTLV